MSNINNNFNHDNPFTIGIEEEYMLCNPNNGELTNKADEIIASLSNDIIDRYSYELILSEIEVNTSVCNNVNEALDEIISLRQKTAEIGKNIGCNIGISGTHPTALCDKQKFVKNDAYQWVAKQLDYYARRNVTFATHVHIAVDDKECAIHVTNSLRRWIAPLLALSTNSPFFEGKKTGLKSTRTFQFGIFPRTNIPVTINTFKEYEQIIDKYLLSGTIQKPRQIWWKIRPHIQYGTIEFRICDMQRSLKKLKMIVALSQALVYQAVEDYKNGCIIEEYNMEYLNDSLWKATRFSFDIGIIDPLSEEISTLKDQVNIMINYAKDALSYFSTADIIKTANDICIYGTEADDQIKIYDKVGFSGLKRYLIDNTEYKLI